jgi:hypothetical protein
MNHPRRLSILLLAGVFAGGLSMVQLARGQSVLDQQLGNKDASPPAPSPPPPAAGPAPINPSAAKAVDDDDLVKQLINPSNGPKDTAPNPDQQLQEMLQRMADSQKRLIDKDPGAVTQESQRRIITDLDGVIDILRKQQQNPQSQSKPSDQPAQQKQESKGNHSGNGGKPGNTAAQQDQLSRGDVDAPVSNGQDLRNKGPSEWGNLPPKDRDLISNGVNEQYLPAYKDMIDRYYQALAEVGKTKEKQ